MSKIPNNRIFEVQIQFSWKAQNNIDVDLEISLLFKEVNTEELANDSVPR